MKRGGGQRHRGKERGIKGERKREIGKERCDAASDLRPRRVIKLKPSATERQIKRGEGRRGEEGLNKGPS